MVYVYEGKIALGEANTPSGPQTLSRLIGDGNLKLINNGDTTAQVVILAGTALKEPIAQHGPFVMNTMDEINQAIEDYQNGVLT